MAAACPPTPAAITTRAEADYPEMARMAHLEGTAIIKIDLDATGKVSKTTVQKSAGSGLLDTAAMKAAKATGYKPATEECKPVASVYLMVVDMHQ